MSILTKAIIFILIAFLSSGCTTKYIKPKIPTVLTSEVKHPTPPKVKTKIHKQVAIFIIKQDEALQKCNLKLQLIRNLYPP